MAKTKCPPRVAPATFVPSGTPRVAPPEYVDRMPSPREGFVYLACNNPSCDRGAIFEVAEHRANGVSMSCSDTCAGVRARYDRAVREKQILAIPNYKSLETKMVCSTCFAVEKVGHHTPAGKLLKGFACSACRRPKKESAA